MPRRRDTYQITKVDLAAIRLATGLIDHLLDIIGGMRVLHMLWQVEGFGADLDVAQFLHRPRNGPATASRTMPLTARIGGRTRSIWSPVITGTDARSSHPYGIRKASVPARYGGSIR